MIRVAINGFGRIGRMIFKAGLNREDIEFFAVNDLTDTKTLAHLFKYDSVHGKFDGTIEATENSLIINGKELKVFAEKDPSNLPWGENEIDLVMECTGFFRTKEACRKHIEAGAKKVLLSAPPKGDEKFDQIIMGVNEHEIPEDVDIISNGSCTTNCSAPIFKVINDNFKIQKGYLTTSHAYTSSQRLVDAPLKDLRRARAAAENIIPTSTGAAKAVAEVIPELKGKLDGTSLRVPIACGSITDFSIVVEKNTTVKEINELFKNVSEHHLKGILEYTEEPLVSKDIITNPHSTIFDSTLTKVIDGNLIKIFSWYDNEWGFSCRMVDLAIQWLD